MSLTISIDAMGGDFGPEVTVPASLDCLKNNPDLKLILVGDSVVLKQQLGENLSVFQGRLTVQHASQRVEMHESPSKALKNKKDSSMRVAINLVHEGHADACVQHAEEALKHAMASGAKNPHLDEGLKHLTEAVKHGKAGHAEACTEHASGGATHLAEVK